MGNESGKNNKDLIKTIETILAELEAKGQISRRTFHKAMLGAGLALGAGGAVLPGCWNKSSDASRGSHTEKRTLHFDLSTVVGEHQHTLHVAGTRYGLTAHTRETRASAKAADPSLANYPDSRLTHFVADVELNADRPQRFHVTSTGPRGDGLASVALHIPSASRQAARAARIRSGRYGTKARSRADDTTACIIHDEISDDFHTAQDTAKAILFHHPEIMNLDPDKAAIIENIMDNSAGVANLANAICSQGPAYETDPRYSDGWAVLTPILNDDSTPRLDSRGGRMYDYVFTDRTNAAIKDAVKEVLRLVKDNTDLAGSSYTVKYNDPVVNPGGAAPVSGVMRDATSAGVQLSSTSPGWNNLVWFGDPVITNWDQASRSFTIDINNMAFLYYGIYIQYRSEDDTPIVMTDSNLLTMADEVLTDLRAAYVILQTAKQGGVGPIGIDGTPSSTAYPNSPVVTPALPLSAVDWFENLETDTIRFYSFCSPPGTVLGIPIPNLNTQLVLELPEGASKARIMLCGPGFGGNVDHLETVLIGWVLTVIVQYGIPGYFLMTTTGEDEDISLKTLLKSKGLWLQLFMAAKSVVSGIANRDQAHALAIGSSMEGVLEAAVNVVLQIMAKGLVLDLMKWMMTKWTSEQLEENIPYLGWAFKIAANAGSVADVLATTAEICTRPAVIENTVSFSQSVVVTVYPDPMHNVFPLTARTLEASIAIGGRTFTKTIDLTSEDLARPQLTITLTGIPATGKDENIEVRLYSDTNWLAANSAKPQSDNTWLPGPISFSNRPTQAGSANAQVRLLENPVPITATTQYTHHQKLIYAGGAYQWQYSSNPPALDTLDCSAAGGLCQLGNISLWVPGGMIGYSWRASSPGVGQCGGGGSGQLYTFRNVSFRADPAAGMKSPGCGFSDPAPIAYDPRPEAPRHYFLDAVSISTTSPEYHLRKIVLDATTPVDTSRSESWGRFRMPLDRMAVHPGGYVIGISTENSKMGVLQIPDQAYPSDAEAMNSTLVLGEGTNSDRLVYRPLALTINRHGVILLLEGGSTKRIKAFNTDGSPCKFFVNQTSSVMTLTPESGNITWLDIAIDPTDLMFVLSFANAGANVNDYRLDVYKTDGTRIVRNTGIAVARMTMDPWRNLYSLNREKIAGLPRNEPSVSLWTPSTP